jgi:hypothetical protein
LCSATIEKQQYERRKKERKTRAFKKSIKREKDLLHVSSLLIVDCLPTCIVVFCNNQKATI